MPNRKHILIYTEWYPHSGDPQLGVFVEKFAIAAARNFRVTVLFIRGDIAQKNKINTESETGNPRIIRSTFRKSSFRPFNLMRYAEALKAAKLLIGNVDLIHLHVTGKNYMGKKYFFRETPFVITEHWSGFLSGDNKSLIGETKTKEAFTNARSVSCVSEHLAEKITQRFGRNDIDIIPNIIEKIALRDASQENETKIIVVADLVDEIKNISGILEALKKINTKKRIVLQIIGDGSDRLLLEKKAAQISRQNISIRFAGRLRNPETLFQIAQSDFMIVNSRTETFSMAAAEAIAAGVPVIATRCGGPEQFIHSGNGVLIESENENELIEALLHMIENCRTYNHKKMSEEILAKYGVDQIAVQIRDFYSKALSTE